jgi:hypothetical protein
MYGSILGFGVLRSRCAYFCPAGGKRCKPIRVYSSYALVEVAKSSLFLAVAPHYQACVVQMGETSIPFEEIKTG